LFCRFYSVTRSAKESAMRAGYDSLPEIKGLYLLTKSRIRECIKEFDEVRAKCGDGVKSGLERVAFGGVNDAVKLLFSDDLSEEELEQLDLFCVSEIKRPKSGGVEIKFFDRLKALEKLSEFSDGLEGNASPFFNAVEEGAKRLYSKGE